MLDLLENIAYFFKWVSAYASSVIASIRSIIAWITPVIDFFNDSFGFLPTWVEMFLGFCIAIEVAIFILHLGGE